MKPETYTMERIDNGWVVRIWRPNEKVAVYKKTLKAACDYIRKHESTWVA